jgi:hypothetical protein
VKKKSPTKIPRKGEISFRYGADEEFPDKITPAKKAPNVLLQSQTSVKESPKRWEGWRSKGFCEPDGTQVEEGRQ